MKLRITTIALFVVVLVLVLVLAGCPIPTSSNEATSSWGSLPYGSWVNGELVSSEQIDRYQFSADANIDYLLQWDDRSNGAGDKTARLSVSARRASNGSEIFSNSTDGSRPIKITANDTIYIEVKSYGETGTYALMYYNMATIPPQNAPSDLRILRVVGNPSPACVVTWSPMSGATGYKLYRSVSEASGYGEVYSGDYTSYTDTAVTAGVQYWYKVSAVNANGEGVLSTAVSDTLPASGSITALTPADWANGNIATAGEVDLYKFTAAAGTTYYLQWDDSGQGSGAYTCDVKVSAYRASDTGTILSATDSGYSSPRSVSVSPGDTIYVRVEGYSTGSTGTYAVRYYEEQ
jgi:hypothetical protein